MINFDIVVDGVLGGFFMMSNDDHEFTKGYLLR